MANAPNYKLRGWLPAGRGRKRFFDPLQSATMFAARPFPLNTASAALAGVASRAISTKTTTIKG